ncbi:ABC transporter ATP-binding protein [bacterium]|nr:ABC transporter ATP-binding protein [bacterium]
MQPIVVCNNLCHEFQVAGGTIQVLKDISLEIYPGELTMLVGPSGCGKTTLISVIAGLLRHSAGDVFVLGKNIAKLSSMELLKLRREKIGFIFQQFNLLLGLSSNENAAVPLVANQQSWETAQAKSNALLTQLGMGNHLEKLPRQLSGGQQQRVAIARALVHDPKLLLCDEPTASLDSQSGQTVMKLLTELAVKPDRAAIVVTHDPRIYAFADRVVHMEDGRIDKVEQGKEAIRLQRH